MIDYTRQRRVRYMLKWLAYNRFAKKTDIDINILAAYAVGRIKALPEPKISELENVLLQRIHRLHQRAEKTDRSQMDL